MFLLRRNIDECIAVFKQLAKRVFLCKLVGGSSIDDIDCVVCVFYGCVPDAGYIYGVVD
jgi:hypothetical protein